MNSISPNLNLMIKACEKASKILIRDFGEIEKLQVSKKGPSDFVTNSDHKTEKIKFSYFGGLSRERSLVIIIKAINQLLVDKPEYSKFVVK